MASLELGTPAVPGSRRGNVDEMSLFGDTHYLIMLMTSYLINRA